MGVANALAYYDMSTLTTVKSFIDQVLGELLLSANQILSTNLIKL
jgi:hypothetical protein